MKPRPQKNARPRLTHVPKLVQRRTFPLHNLKRQRKLPMQIGKPVPQPMPMRVRHVRRTLPHPRRRKPKQLKRRTHIDALVLKMVPVYKPPHQRTPLRRGQQRVPLPNQRHLKMRLRPPHRRLPKQPPQQILKNLLHPPRQPRPHVGTRKKLPKIRKLLKLRPKPHHPNNPVPTPYPHLFPPVK